jgi:hypothetical protein
MSAQRVTSSVEAKPCRLKVSARKPLASSDSERVGLGLFIARWNRFAVEVVPDRFTG